MKVALFALLCLTACGTPTSLLPDGGRVRQLCTNHPAVFSLKVVDVKDNPFADVTVVATNTGTKKSVTGKTDAWGLTRVITEELGPGDFKVEATSGALKSAPFTAQWSCGECDCFATPNSATLVIQ